MLGVVILYTVSNVVCLHIFSLFIQRVLFFFFFFQAEDGIRDKLVTGVQTCALPIFGSSASRRPTRRIRKCSKSSGPERGSSELGFRDVGEDRLAIDRQRPAFALEQIGRASVGKECRCRWSP